jgi:hypothetical protein
MPGNKKPGTRWTRAPGKRKYDEMTKSQFDNTDKGALFKNRNKETDSQPDYLGPLNVGGVNFRIAAWLKDSAGGQKYMSLSIKPDTEQSTAAKPKPAAADVPF